MNPIVVIVSGLSALKFYLAPIPLPLLIGRDCLFFLFSPKPSLELFSLFIPSTPVPTDGLGFCHDNDFGSLCPHLCFSLNKLFKESFFPFRFSTRELTPVVSPLLPPPPLSRILPSLPHNPRYQNHLTCSFPILSAHSSLLLSMLFSSVFCTLWLVGLAHSRW